MSEQGEKGTEGEAPPRLPKGSSFDDITHALKGFGVDDQVIQAIREIVTTDKDDPWRDLPFKSDINDKEAIWLSVIYATYIVRWKSKPIENFLEFYMKVLTSKKGKRVEQYVEGLKPKIWAMQRAEEEAAQKKSRFGKG